MFGHRVGASVGGAARTNLIWAQANQSAAAAGTLTPALPQGSVGKPVVMRVSSAVSGVVTLAISNSQNVTAVVTANQPPTERAIPDKAFPSKVNGVPVTFALAAAGFIAVEIGFEP
jgi:hypothetical protein